MRGPFRLKVFAVVTLAAALVLLTIVVVPQWFSKQARLEVLRSHVAQVARLAASAVDGDLHRTLLDAQQYNEQRYRKALEPLVRFHLANAEVFYVYTMIDRDGETFFVLDTANDPGVAERTELRPSKYMEHFRSTEVDPERWIEGVKAGHTWVYPDFQSDDFGQFLTGHAPIYDSEGRYSGFAGVDFDLNYYLTQERRFRAIGVASIIAALVASLLIGAAIASYHRRLEQRMQTHYESSMRDELTGLLNRRGAMEAIRKALSERERSYAALLIDIDDLKQINDTLGHLAGDAAIVNLAATIRTSVRERDLAARLGGDEFLVFAPNTDLNGAREIAHRILEAAEEGLDDLPRYSVSVGICAQDGKTASFDFLYRRADEALYRAKTAGKNRMFVYDEVVVAG